MRHSPHVRACLAFGLLLVTAAPAAAESWSEQSSATLDGRTTISIEVRNARGLIDVRPSSDGAIHVRAMKRAHGRDAAEARSLAGRTVVRLDRGPAVKIEVVYPRVVRHLNLWSDAEDDRAPRTEVCFSIEIPARLAVTLESASGELRTEGLGGTQALKTASGDIRVLDADGPVRARTASGDVEVLRAGGGSATSASGSVRWGEASGPLAISTASGDIEVGSARDSLRLDARSGSIRVDRAPGGIVAETASGAISVREAAGRVDLEAASGSVRAGLARGTRSASLRAASGDVTVSLERTVGWTVRARTAGGLIEMDESATVERRSRHDLEARIRGGGAPVEVTTASGSVRVEGGRP